MNMSMAPALDRGSALTVRQVPAIYLRPVRVLADRIFASIEGQLTGLLLAPGSTYSIAALFCTLIVTILLTVRGRQRPVAPAVLLRAVFPRRMWRTPSGRADALYFIWGVLFAGLAIGWAIWSADAIRTKLVELIGMPTAPLWHAPAFLSQLVATVALFLAAEFGYWLDHWLKHRVPALWRFHKIHHQAESLSFATNGRIHPVDTIIFHNILAVATGLTGFALLLLVGEPRGLGIGGTNALVMVSAVFLTHLQHSHLWIGFGPRWGRVLLGPAHHQLHHSVDPAHHGSNLGSSLALFDRLFGTFLAPSVKRPALRFGVSDGTADPHGLYAATLAPFDLRAAMSGPLPGNQRLVR